MRNYFYLALVIICAQGLFAQNILDETQIRGFVHFDTRYDVEAKKASFGVGEQDLFITSEVSDKVSFLGESVFKYSGVFQASIERVVIKYNLKGNHNLLFGKHHTPVNYWNDTYHHGRVFFPTIDRPKFFGSSIFPIHTVGASIQGQNLGDMRFGYDVMIGNGLSAGDNSTDDNAYKSITAAVHVKPIDGMRIGVSAYYDHISVPYSNLLKHGPLVVSAMDTITYAVHQQLYTASFAYFESRFEVLSEGTYTRNNSEFDNGTNTYSFYAYVGYHPKDSKWVPYVRVDVVDFDEDDNYYNVDNVSGIVLGTRYEHNYKTVIKFEYQYADSELSGGSNILKTQIAIGF